MDNNIDHPLTLTVEETAKLLGIGRSTAYELVHTGDIPSLRLGRRIVVPVARLAELLTVAPLVVADAGLLPSSGDGHGPPPRREDATLGVQALF
jgi:excisionase family DNA binding protein